jgi:protein O-mannosyl-transferase
MSFENRVRLALAAGTLLLFAPSLTIREFVRDDQAFIEQNPLYRSGLEGARRLLTTGYIEGAEGRATPVQEYRPLLTLTYWAQAHAGGLDPRPFHAANVLLHAAVVLLVFEALRRRLPKGRAAAAAAFFAALPVHVEAVSYVTSRSELLTALFLLAAWLLLEPPRPRVAAGAAAFSAALLTKEHSVLFPVFLAASDWVFHGATPARRERRPVYAALGACLAAYLALRLALFPGFVKGGVPYFASTPALSKLLTLSRFWAEHYAWPALTGLGLCPDFSRPLIPDAPLSSPGAWLCLLALAAALAAAARALARREPRGFWALAPLVFLLPTSHLFFPLDTIGAERFLYIPTLGLAAGLAAAARRPLLLLALLGWYGARTRQAQDPWRSELAFYEHALSRNPLASKLHSSLGGYWLRRGKPELGLPAIDRALALDSESAHAHYNLARWSWDRKDYAQAAGLARRSLALEPGSVDARLLLGAALLEQGRAAEASAPLEEAAALKPWSPEARYNLGRALMALGKNAEAAAELERFAQLAPGDPDAPAVRVLAARLRTSGEAPRKTRGPRN